LEKINELLQNKNGNYLYPFFWQHGESEDVLRSFMDKIDGSGMKAVCIEARPHPDFLGDKWWKDIDIILDEAKKRNMKLWILDDSHFPTGFANGKIKEEYPQYKKLYIDMRRYDVTGPMKCARINMKLLKGRPWERPNTKDQVIVGIFVAKRCSEYNQTGDPVDIESLVEIKERPVDGILTLDIPKGSWSVFVVFSTHAGGEKSTEDYLNPLVKEATQVLVDTVYEPHYEHYKEEFGKTILGFFSDEPRFGNQKGTDSSIGKVEMVLPWREGLEKELPFEIKYLPLLFARATGKEADIRCKYMDLVTRLYAENFTAVMGKWCAERGVHYLGHNIEDNGAHARLGYGTGHYFRGQTAQSFSGIDVIGTQIVPGMPYHHDAFATGGCDGEFFHFALAKLGASAAHLESNKGGRAMCEAFGAYGWNEGLKLMKWITDHLIVRGINYIVPHAFSPKEYPDWDCPPHFDAHGHNPQFRYFKNYTDYANRLMHLFQDGVHRAPVGVLYPAEQEWAGEYMPIEKTIRQLTEHQIDCDIISSDYLEKATLHDGSFHIEKESFKVLVVPYGQYLPKSTIGNLIKLAENNIKVIFVDGYPEKIFGWDNVNDGKRVLESICEVVELSKLADSCDSYREIKLQDYFKDLVYYHYENTAMHSFMFFNESISEVLDTKVNIPSLGYAYEYDAYENKLYEIATSDAENKYNLYLEPYQSKVFLFTEKPLKEANSQRSEINTMLSKELDLKWKMSFADSFQYPNFKQEILLDKLKDISLIEAYENKTGTVRYKTELQCDSDKKSNLIDLGEVYEVAEVFVNGKSAGVRICPPYRYDISNLLMKGKNDLIVEVTNTLGNETRDALSQYLVIEPFGMIGPVKLYEKGDGKDE
jgi:hypothetical protein